MPEVVALVVEVAVLVPEVVALVVEVAVLVAGVALRLPAVVLVDVLTLPVLFTRLLVVDVPDTGPVVTVDLRAVVDGLLAEDELVCEVVVAREVVAVAAVREVVAVREEVVVVVAGREVVAVADGRDVAVVLVREVVAVREEVVAAGAAGVAVAVREAEAERLAPELLEAVRDDVVSTVAAEACAAVMSLAFFTAEDDAVGVLIFAVRSLNVRSGCCTA